MLKYRPGPRKSSIYTIFKYITNPGLWLHMAVFYNSFPERHGTMTADRGARQTARGPPPARLVAPPTPPTPEMGRPSSLTPKDARVGIQTRAQPGHAGPGFRISTAELSGNHPNGAPPAGVLRAAAAAPLGCAVLYTVISTCRFRAAAGCEGRCWSPPRPGRLRYRRTGSPFQYKYSNSSTI